MPRKKQEKRIVKGDELEGLTVPEEEISVEDVEKVLNQGQTDLDDRPENPWFTFKFPYKIVCVGKSFSGKTVLILNLLTKYLYFDTLTIIGRTVQYQQKFDLFTDLAQLFPDKFFVHETIKEMRMRKYKKELVNFVLIDDAQEEDEKDIRKFNHLYTAGRHHGICPCFIAQDYFKAPIRARANTSHFIFFRLNSLRNIRRIHQEIASDLHIDQFTKMFMDATEPSDDDHSFLVVDTTAKTSTERYRKGLNQFYLGD